MKNCGLQCCHCWNGDLLKPYAYALHTHYTQNPIGLWTVLLPKRTEISTTWDFLGWNEWEHQVNTSKWIRHSLWVYYKCKEWSLSASILMQRWRKQINYIRINEHKYHRQPCSSIYTFLQLIFIGLSISDKSVGNEHTSNSPVAWF
jgi:hypothetical protein